MLFRILFLLFLLSGCSTITKPTVVEQSIETINTDPPSSDHSNEKESRPVPTAIFRPPPPAPQIVRPASVAVIPVEEKSPAIVRNTNKNSSTAKLLKVPKKFDTVLPQSEDDIANQLRTANMSFSVPDKANINDSVRIELLINLQKELQNLEKDLTESGKIYSNQVLVSKILIANITAPAFEVKNITPERQILSSSQNTSWLWTLKPLTAGKHKIDIGITALIKLNGEESEHHIKTLKKTVDIEITTTQIAYQWLLKYWQWISTTILIPLIIWIYKNRKQSKE